MRRGAGSGDRPLILWSDAPTWPRAAAVVGVPSPRKRGEGTITTPELEPDGCSVQIVLIGTLDLHARNFTNAQRPSARDIDRAVDLRRIALAAPLGDARAGRIDDHLLATADLALEPPRRHLLLARHEPVPARLFDVVRNERGEIVGGRALHWLVAKAADAIELCCIEPVDELLEIGVGLAREADDEGRADGELRADRAPGPDAIERLFLRGRPA